MTNFRDVKVRLATVKESISKMSEEYFFFLFRQIILVLQFSFGYSMNAMTPVQESIQVDFIDYSGYYCGDSQQSQGKQGSYY